MKAKIVSARHLLNDFPELKHKSYREVPLPNCFYIEIDSEEMFSDDKLYNRDIDLILGTPGTFKKLALSHGATMEENDFYFCNRWDAEQVVAYIKSIASQFDFVFE